MGKTIEPVKLMSHSNHCSTSSCPSCWPIGRLMMVVLLSIQSPIELFFPSGRNLKLITGTLIIRIPHERRSSPGVCVKEEVHGRCRWWASVSHVLIGCVIRNVSMWGWCPYSINHWCTSTDRERLRDNGWWGRLGSSVETMVLLCKGLCWYMNQ